MNLGASLVKINFSEIVSEFHFTANPSNVNFVYQIILVNTVLVAAYFLLFTILGKFRPTLCKSIVMLLTPPIGVICFFINFILSLFDRKSAIDYEELTFSKEKKQFAKQTDYETEKEFVPLEEALIISDVTDKRHALLNVLKADVSNNMSSLVKALDNEDSETAHYAASALMDMIQKYTKRLTELSAKYKSDKKDMDVNREYADLVCEYMNSGVLGEVELKKQAHLYIELVENLNKNHPEALDSDHYRYIVSSLIKLGKYDEADQWANLSIERQPNVEQSYLNLLDVKYKQENWDEFKTALDRMIKSDVQLSQKGIGAIRFWNKR